MTRMVIEIIHNLNLHIFFKSINNTSEITLLIVLLWEWLICICLLRLICTSNHSVWHASSSACFLRVEADNKNFLGPAFVSQKLVDRNLVRTW